jgi:hypothetical protein
MLQVVVTYIQRPRNNPAGVDAANDNKIAALLCLQLAFLSQIAHEHLRVLVTTV